MKYLFNSICILFLISSCNTGPGQNIPTYIIENQDFENALKIEGTVEPVNTAIVSSPPFMEGVISSLIEDGTYVEEGDVLCVIEVQELVTEYENMVTNVETLKAALEITKANLDLQYAILDAQVKNNEAETSIALLDSVSLRFATPTQKRINELELKKVMIEKEKLRKKLEALAVVNQTEIRRLELEIRRISGYAENTKERLEALTLKAPQKGLALRMLSRNNNTNKLQIGDPVWHQTPIISIPEMDKMKVKIKATEADFKLISVEDSVIFTFDAMPGNMGWGKIRLKTPVGQQYKEDSKVKFFEMEASIDSVLHIPEPGLTANCRIILTHVNDTIVVPQIAVTEADSMKVIYVKTPKGYEMRQVETGLSSQKEIIISSGLQRGEEITLIPPSTDQIKSKILLPVIPVKETDKVIADTIQTESINIQENNEE